jgi:hypothetical protein
MRVFGSWLSILLSLFIFASFLAGVFIQIHSEFYVGMFIVLLSLGIELMREISKSEKKRKLRWRDVVGLGFGALMSIAGLLLSFLLALAFGGRTFHILLLDSALSTMVFLFNSFLRFWKYLHK